MISLPRAANLALWFNAWLAGSASPDDVHEALGVDLHHVFIGLDPTEPLAWAAALGAMRQLGSPATVALTAPGDPLGLAGPSRFNASVMESGEALLLPHAGLGFIPVQIGGAIEWRSETAVPPAPLDPREARQQLRQELREITEELADMGITSWNNEIPDLLINRREALRVPAGIAPQDVDALNSAALCLAITTAAADVEPGAISAWERSRFEVAMRRLDSAARRVLVAVCGPGSDSLTSP